MATYAGVTSADPGVDGQGLKRRNVPTTEITPADEIRQELDTKKEQAKQVRSSSRSIGRVAHCMVFCRALANLQNQWQSGQSILSLLDEYEFIIAPIIFTLLSFFTRMYKIGRSPIVTWDEAQ